MNDLEAYDYSVVNRAWCPPAFNNRGKSKYWASLLNCDERAILATIS
jgi:hypothetical protein